VPRDIPWAGIFAVGINLVLLAALIYRFLIA
jgi:hypothetical protein